MRKSGQTLFELVIAVGVAVLVVTGIVALVTLSLRNSGFARDQALATRYAQDALEWLRSERDNGWNTFYSRTTISTWCLNSLGWTSPGSCGSNKITGTKFGRQAEFSVIDANSVNAQVRVSWTDSQGTHQSKIDTVLVNQKTNP
ncbi:MAG: hypothetical protein HYW33_02205 [Candidatus Blackburnbacteria bacterium]|nr:hypothetical protein [Candidatus Blackburnbacteria bacterium]